MSSILKYAWGLTLRSTVYVYDKKRIEVVFKFDDILMRAIEKYQKGGGKRSMTFKNFICKGVLVFTGLLLIGWLGQYIYIVNGEID